MIPAANVPLTGEVGEGRRRHDADDVGIDAEARRAGCDRRNEHVAGSARVLPDDDRPTATDELVRHRATQRVGRRRLEVDVGDPTDAVGSEQAGHAVSRPVTVSASAAVDVIVIVTVDGLIDTSGRPGRQRKAPGHGLGSRPESGDIEIDDEGRAAQSIEVGHRATDRHQDPIHVHVVRQPGTRPDQPVPGV